MAFASKYGVDVISYLICIVFFFFLFFFLERVECFFVQKVISKSKHVHIYPDLQRFYLALVPFFQ